MLKRSRLSCYKDNMWDNEPERLEPVDAPQLESGAPIPNVLACEYSLIFTYGLQNPSLFDGEVPRTDTPIDRETRPLSLYLCVMPFDSDHRTTRRFMAIACIILGSDLTQPLR